MSLCRFSVPLLLRPHFRLRPKRDVAAAKAFFPQGLQDAEAGATHVTLDGYQASHRAVRELRAEDRKLRFVTVRSCQYLNNIVEQDHRGVNYVCGRCWD